MKTIKTRLSASPGMLLSALLIFFFMSGTAQVPITASTLVYNQNFDNFQGTAASVTSDLPGWTVTVKDNKFQGRACGSGTTGAAYAFGSGTDYALGYLPSSSVDKFTARVTFVNNTGAVITGLAISYDFENWRREARTNGFSVTSNIAGADVSALSQASPAGGSGNCSAVSNSKSVTLTGLTIASGAAFYLEWAGDRGGGSGSSQGVAIDNFRLTATMAAPPCSVTAPGAVASTAGNSFCGTGSTTLSLTGTTPSSGISYQWKSSADSVTWTNAGTNATLAVNPAGTTFYKCVVKCAAGTSSDSTPGYKVTINPQPSAMISGSTNVCSGSSAAIIFNGTPDATVTYTAGTVSRTIALDGSGSAAINPYFTVSDTTYSIVSVAKGSCSQNISGQQTTVQVLPSPVVSISNDTALCAGASAVITFTGTPGATVAYNAGTSGRTLELDGSGSAVLRHIFTSDTVYTILSVREGSCTQPVTGEQATVHVYPLPAATVQAGGATLICENDSVALTAAAGTGYSYQWKNGTLNEGRDQVFYAKATGNYKVIVTDASNCMDSSVSVSVTTHALPVISIAQGDTSFCSGGVIYLKVITTDTGLDFRWKESGADVANAIADFLEVSSTGVYSVVAGRASVANCAVTSVPVNVTVYPVIRPEIRWDGMTLHTGTHFVSYQWFAGGLQIYNATDSTFVPSEDGAYTVMVTDSNGCISTSLTYNVRNVPAMQISGSVSGGYRVQLYPNPTAGMIHIQSAEAVNVVLGSMDGKQVLEQKQVRAIDLSLLADGIYLLRILDQNGMLIMNERVVKRSL